MQVRTDLAEEAQALWRQSAGKTTQLEGVKARSWEEHGVGRHQVQILNEQGEKALGKPRGTYETLWVPGDGRPTPEAAEALGEAVRDLLDLRGGESVLVVGLGNRAMTPDAVGPLSAGGILVTRHLRQQLPQIFGGVRPVSALVPGVLGTTGVESAEIVQSVVEATRPDRRRHCPRLRRGQQPGCLFCRNPWRAGGGRRCAHGDGCPAAGGAGAPHGDASGCGCPGAPFVKPNFCRNQRRPLSGLEL